MRRLVAVLSFAVLLVPLGTEPASAHAGLRRSEPPLDAAVDVAPTAVRLSFSEEPEPSLSSIRVVDAEGAAHQQRAPEPAADDPLSLVVALGPLEQGVYTVVWRVVSRVDGHPTAGAFAFGVGVSPTVQATAAAALTENPAPSRREMAARWLLAAGLVLLLGAACAHAIGFGGDSRSIGLALGGWVVAAAGLVLLVDSQRRSAGASLDALGDTAIGRALVWRAVALVIAGAAVASARWGPRYATRTAWTVTAVATATAMAVHVAAGHAAGGSTTQWTRVASQWAHFAAVGIWVGGLVALLRGVRGGPSEAKAAAVRRFSAIAAVALGIVVVTGVLRSFDELTNWGDLTSSGYGRTVMVKSAVLVAMACLGAANRRRSVPAATTSLRGLRRLSGGEIALGAVALAAAALLTTLTPPASQAAEPVGIVATGADFATSVRVRLTTQSTAPGPNRFVVRAVDYDSGRSLRADRVSLRFEASDDPDVAPTTLALEAAPDGTYVGAGSHLSLDGRWRVTVLLERGRDTVSAPLEVQARGAPQFVSVERIPGRPVRYLVEVSPGIYARLFADPGGAGPNQVNVAFIDDFGDERRIDSLVLTTGVENGVTRQHGVRRVGPGRFAADVVLDVRHPTTLAVVAKAGDGTRYRAEVDLDDPDAKR